MPNSLRQTAWILAIWSISPACDPVRAVDGQPVSFAAADGFQISADYFPPKAAEPPAPIVILLHMYRSDRSAWKPLIDPLHQAGFAILAIDMRGHGESATSETRRRAAERDTRLFEDVQYDLRGAYDWLSEQKGVDRARFAVVGASVGCSIALQYAAKDRSVDAVVCLSPGLKYLGLDSPGDIKQISGRRILMLATQDERKAPETLQRLNKGAKTRVFRGKQAHGTQMFGDVDGVQREIVEFLKQAVGEPTKTTVYSSIQRMIYHPPESKWIERISSTNLRYFSSPEEAEARGLRKTRSLGPDDRPRQGRRP